MYRTVLLMASITLFHKLAFCWGFYAHREINHHAVFSLPPAMMVFYKPHIDFLREHSVDPDKRRYVAPEEACRHYIDIDKYGQYPYATLPRNWNDAVHKYGEDSLKAHGIVPWWIQVMLERLTRAFQDRNYAAILRLSADIGHYVSDAHVPLHAHSNYNGQFTNQHGIHGLWESRIPELMASRHFSYFVGKAVYIRDPEAFIWNIVLESAAAADTVLLSEQQLTSRLPPDQKYSFENRNGVLVRQYSTYFTTAYNAALGDMVERRMQQSIAAVASLWYTAWINAGQPSLTAGLITFPEDDLRAIEELDKQWKKREGEGIGQPLRCIE